MLQKANRADYVLPDVTGTHVDAGQQPGYWNDCRDLLKSSAALKDVLARWRSDASVRIPIRSPSHQHAQVSATQNHTLDYDLLTTNNQQDSADLRSFTNTTHSLLEYQLYASLAHVQDSSRNRNLEWNERTTVSSMQMPHVSSAEDLERAKEVVIRLIYALVDSRRFRGSDYDDEEEGDNGLG